MDLAEAGGEAHKGWVAASVIGLHVCLSLGPDTGGWTTISEEVSETDHALDSVTASGGGATGAEPVSARKLPGIDAITAEVSFYSAFVEDEVRLKVSECVPCKCKTIPYIGACPLLVV